MGSLPDPSNEQKLTYIYQVLKAQEARRKRKALGTFLKWVVLIALLTYIYVFKELVIYRTHKFVADSVNNGIRRISEKQKADILKGIQQLIPPSLENTLKEVQKVIQTGSGDIIPAPNNTATTKKSSTTTKQPVKK